MALFKRSDLKARASRQGFTESLAKSEFIKNASEERDFDIFLSHSYLDAAEIKVLAADMKAMGFSVYVDWIEDPSLDRSKVTKKTAELLRQRMKRCKSLFYATSPNSPNSRWMSWELGYFDGFKNRVAIVPVVDDTSTTADKFTGQEYLGLYPYVANGLFGEKQTLWIHWDADVYVDFKSWLTGAEPSKRT